MMKNLIPALICLFLAIPCQAGVIYVDDDADVGGNGQTWGTAYKYLQDALDDAESGDEIWVAAGTYRPDNDTANHPDGTGLRTDTFQLLNGVAIYGGFAGTETTLDERDVELYETILSGDLDGNDTPGLDPCDLPDDPNRGENSYHVVTGSGTDANAVLDGFTITASNANGTYPDSAGGGMDNRDAGSPTVNDCKFIENLAEDDGAGMSNENNSNTTVTYCVFSGNIAGGAGGGMLNDGGSPTVSNCTFAGNSAGSGGGMFNWGDGLTLTNCTFSNNISKGLLIGGGGGMFNNGSSTLTNCTFSGNSTYYDGGGMFNWDSSPTLTNCTFTSNSASYYGGGMLSSDGNPTLTDCIFSGNTAGDGGGGMFNLSSNPTLTNCTFSGNSAANGGGINNFANSNPTVTNCAFSGNSAADGGGVYNGNSSPTLTNCTFSGNSSDNYGGGMYNYYDYYGSTTLTNCIVWGNTAGIDGNQIALYSADYPSMLTMSYSDLEGGLAGVYIDPNCSVIWGLGNIEADPCFFEPGRWVDVNDPNIVVEPNDPNAIWVDGDYHLQSEGWRWSAEREMWTWDEVTSRCIDAGNPGSPLADELMSVPDDPCNIWGENIRINMGAYGGTAEASMPPYDWTLLSDMTNDGTVDFVDFAHTADMFTNQDDELPGDFDRDGDVDYADLALLTEDWLRETTWHE